MSAVANERRCRVEHATRVPFAATRREDRELARMTSHRRGHALGLDPGVAGHPRRVAEDGTRVACSTQRTALAAPVP